MAEIGEKYRVAIASSDGIIVDSHFGHVDVFLIFEVDEETGEFNQLENKKLNAACGGGECGGVANKAIVQAKNCSGCEIKIPDDPMDLVADALASVGVNYVLCARIGPHAIQALARKNISAYDIVLPIDDALKKLNTYRLKIKNSGSIKQCL